MLTHNDHVAIAEFHNKAMLAKDNYKPLIPAYALWLAAARCNRTVNMTNQRKFTSLAIKARTEYGMNYTRLLRGGVAGVVDGLLVQAMADEITSSVIMNAASLGEFVVYNKCSIESSFYEELLKRMHDFDHVSQKVHFDNTNVIRKEINDALTVMNSQR